MEELDNFGNSDQEHLLSGQCSPYPSEDDIRKIAADIEVRNAISWQTGDDIGLDTLSYQMEIFIKHIGIKYDLPESDAAVILECCADRTAQVNDLAQTNGVVASNGNRETVEYITGWLCSGMLPPANSAIALVRRAAHADQARLL
jgi:hypothetical protein